MLEFPEQDRVELVFQMCVHPVMHGGRGIHWIADAPVHVRMTDRIGNVMVYKSGQIGDGFLLLLARADGSNTAQTALKKAFTLCSCI